MALLILLCFALASAVIITALTWFALSMHIIWQSNCYGGFRLGRFLEGDNADDNEEDDEDDDSGIEHNWPLNARPPPPAPPPRRQALRRRRNRAAAMLPAVPLCADDPDICLHSRVSTLGSNALYRRRCCRDCGLVLSRVRV